MIAWLRTFLASWRRSILVVVGCLAYLGIVEAVVRVFPHVAPSLGRVWGIIVLLNHIVLYAVSLIVSVMVAWTLAPFIVKAYPETPWADRSDKAKEKFADSVLSVSNAVISATFIGVLVVPFTVFLQAVVRRTDLGSLLWPLLTPGGLPAWQAILLIVLFVLPAVVGRHFRTRALDIYDEIAKPATPDPPLGPNGATSTTRACPVSVDTPTP